MGHHPGEGDVRDLGIVIAATDVGVHAWEPDLFEILDAHRFVRHGNARPSGQFSARIGTLPSLIPAVSPRRME